MNTTQIYRQAITPPKPGEDTKQQVSPDELNRQQAIKMEYESWISHVGTQKFIHKLLQEKQDLMNRAMENPFSQASDLLMHEAKNINKIIEMIMKGPQ